MVRLLLVILLSPLLFGQQPLEFEVASIKPTRLAEGVKIACHGIDSKFARNDMRVGVPLGRCVATSGRLSHMIGFAYDVDGYGPGRSELDHDGRSIRCGS